MEDVHGVGLRSKRYKGEAKRWGYGGRAKTEQSEVKRKVYGAKLRGKRAEVKFLLWEGSRCWRSEQLNLVISAQVLRTTVSQFRNKYAFLQVTGVLVISKSLYRESRALN